MLSKRTTQGSIETRNTSFKHKLAYAVLNCSCAAVHSAAGVAVDALARQLGTDVQLRSVPLDTLQVPMCDLGHRFALRVR
jgi:hypothetical protein